jgi:hypothetical protein
MSVYLGNIVPVFVTDNDVSDSNTGQSITQTSVLPPTLCVFDQRGKVINMHYILFNFYKGNTLLNGPVMMMMVIIKFFILTC